ncbi:MAG: cyclopropane-fatty-acyl-phospholipid synthase family protein [Firmicutes bacterium]|nr:cyclopropane-fatty-acyl-phospholipid synthase family protein [Bacillota bacterium]
MAKGRKTARDMAAKAVVLKLLSRLKSGAVIIDDNGKRHLCGRPVPGEVIPKLKITSQSAWSEIAKHGSSGFGKAYISGWIDCENTDELTTFLRIIVRNLDQIERASTLTNKVTAPARAVLSKQHGKQDQKERDKKNILAHYDLGNDIFESFLDETMSYSCALFSSPKGSLAEAQKNKLDNICQLLSISPADHIVEIGAGWGSFAIYAARNYGCKVTTTTISDAQFHYVKDKIRQYGLSELITPLNVDYRDLKGTYDKLVSIEMIEAVDWRLYETFFAKSASLLKSDGMAVIQAIVISDQIFDRAKYSEDFIKRYVFPGSYIPSITALVNAATSGSDMRLFSLRDIGTHYAQTLKKWRENIELAGEKILNEKFGIEALRLFIFYFCYCEAGFAERRISDIQAVFTKPRFRDQL